MTPQTRHWVMAVPANLILAMCQQQRGKAKEAREFLAQAVAVLDRDVPEPGSPAVGEDWKGWLMCQVLRREAEALIQGKKDAAKP
jgi:hypothetical protein